MNVLEEHINNANTYGINIQGCVGCGKTNLIKDTIKNIKETSFGFNDDIIIISNKREYENEMNVLCSHVKISPIMLKGFLSYCVANHKVPNIIIDNTHSISAFKKLFKAVSQLSFYSLTNRMIIFDDLTFILPKNLSIISLHDIIPIFVFQNINCLSRLTKEMTTIHCNKLINVKHTCDEL